MTKLEALTGLLVFMAFLSEKVVDSVTLAYVFLAGGLVALVPASQKMDRQKLVGVAAASFLAILLILIARTNDSFPLSACFSVYGAVALAALVCRTRK